MRTNTCDNCCAVDAHDCGSTCDEWQACECPCHLPCPPIVHKVYEECPPRAFRELISEVTSIDIMRISLAGPCKLCGETLYHRGERQKETA